MADKKPIVVNSTSGLFEQLQTGDNLDVNNGKIINVATPTAGGDATNKTYVDGRGLTIGKTLALIHHVPIP